MLVLLAALIGLGVALTRNLWRVTTMNRGHRSVWLVLAVASAAACERGAPPAPVVEGPVAEAPGIEARAVEAPAVTASGARGEGTDAAAAGGRPPPLPATEGREREGREPEARGSTGAELRLRDVAPPEREAVTAVVARIRRGGPFPYDKDGSVFRNAERRLPPKPLGFYREYTVPTPGGRTRGARRIVAGKSGELYYTADHYRSFVRIDGGTP